MKIFSTDPATKESRIPNRNFNSYKMREAQDQTVQLDFYNITESAAEE